MGPFVYTFPTGNCSDYGLGKNIRESYYYYYHYYDYDYDYYDYYYYYYYYY